MYLASYIYILQVCIDSGNYYVCSVIIMVYISGNSVICDNLSNNYYYDHDCSCVINFTHNYQDILKYCTIRLVRLPEHCSYIIIKKHTLWMLY